MINTCKNQWPECNCGAATVLPFLYFTMLREYLLIPMSHHACIVNDSLVFGCWAMASVPAKQPIATVGNHHLAHIRETRQQQGMWRLHFELFWTAQQLFG